MEDVDELQRSEWHSGCFRSVILFFYFVFFTNIKLKVRILMIVFRNNQSCEALMASLTLSSPGWWRTRLRLDHSQGPSSLLGEQEPAGLIKSQQHPEHGINHESCLDALLCLPCILERPIFGKCLSAW